MHSLLKSLRDNKAFQITGFAVTVGLILGFLVISANTYLTSRNKRISMDIEKKKINSLIDAVIFRAIADLKSSWYANCREPSSTSPPSPLDAVLLKNDATTGFTEDNPKRYWKGDFILPTSPLDESGNVTGFVAPENNPLVWISPAIDYIKGKANGSCHGKIGFNCCYHYSHTATGTLSGNCSSTNRACAKKTGIHRLTVQFDVCEISVNGRVLPAPGDVTNDIPWGIACPTSRLVHVNHSVWLNTASSFFLSLD